MTEYVKLLERTFDVCFLFQVELTEYVKLGETLYKVDSSAKTDEELCLAQRQITYPHVSIVSV